MGKQKDTKVKPKHAGGRPTKYKPEYCKAILDFFDTELYDTTIETYYYKNGESKETEKRVAKPLPFLSAFARSINVCRDTIREWRDQHPEFSVAYKTAKEMQKEMLINCGLLGLYNATAYIFTAKNIAGMRDKQELIVEGREVGEKISMEEMEKRMEAKKNAGNGIPTG